MAKYHNPQTKKTVEADNSKSAKKLSNKKGVKAAKLVEAKAKAKEE